MEKKKLQKWAFTHLSTCVICQCGLEDDTIQHRLTCLTNLSSSLISASSMREPDGVCSCGKRLTVTPEESTTIYQKWSREHKAQGLGHKKYPRPRPWPRTALPRTDPLEAKDKNAQRHRHKCFPKKGLQKKFLGDLQKKEAFKKFFRRLPNFNGLKNSAVFEPTTGQFLRT